jgi:hypothetical protein
MNNKDYIPTWLIVAICLIVFFAALVPMLIGGKVLGLPQVHYATPITVSAEVRGLEVTSQSSFSYIFSEKEQRYNLNVQDTIETSGKSMLQATPLRQSDLYAPTVQLEVR